MTSMTRCQRETFQRSEVKKVLNSFIAGARDFQALFPFGMSGQFTSPLNPIVATSSCTWLQFIIKMQFDFTLCYWAMESLTDQLMPHNSRFLSFAFAKAFHENRFADRNLNFCRKFKFWGYQHRIFKVSKMPWMIFVPYWEMDFLFWTLKVLSLNFKILKIFKKSFEINLKITVFW